MNGKVNGSGARTCDTMMRDALLHASQQEVAVDGCIMSKMQAIARQLVAMALVGRHAGNQGNLRSHRRQSEAGHGRARATDGSASRHRIERTIAAIDGMGFSAAGRCRIG